MTLTRLGNMSAWRRHTLLMHDCDRVASARCVTVTDSADIDATLALGLLSVATLVHVKQLVLHVSR